MKPELMKAQIHLTNRCNLRCIFCDVPIRYKDWKDLSSEKFIKATKELCKLHPEIVTISGGGEPLLRPTLLMNLMKIFSSAGIKIELITNGTLVSDEVAKTIAKTCTLYRVSLHSTSIKMDELLRWMKNSVRLTYRCIKRIVDYKKELKRDEPKIDIVMVLTKFNMGEIEKMIRKCFSLEVNKLSLRIVHKWGEKYRPSKKQLQELYRKLGFYRKLAEKNGIEFDQDFLPEDIFSFPSKDNKNLQNARKKFPCTLPFREIVIFADGRVASCCNFIIDSKSTLGVDSIEEKGIIDIWFGKKFENLRKIMEMKNWNKLPDTCKECSLDLKPIDQNYR